MGDFGWGRGGKMARKKHDRSHAFRVEKLSQLKYLLIALGKYVNLRTLAYEGVIVFLRIYFIRAIVAEINYTLKLINK